MYICGHDHEEICHETRQCPLCAEKNDREAVETGLRNDLDSATRDAEEARAQLEACREGR